MLMIITLAILAVMAAIIITHQPNFNLNVNKINNKKNKYENSI